MTLDVHGNFGYSTVATAPSPATSGTSLVVAAGEGANFPPTFPYHVEAWNGTFPIASNTEIVKVTNRSTDTLTIVRAQKGTSALSIAVGWQISLPVLAHHFQDIEAPTEYLVNGSQYAITRAGIQAAIDDASTAGGGRVVICALSVTLDGTAIDLKSNVMLEGLPGLGTILKAPANSTSHNMITCYGGTGSASTVNSNVAEGATSIVLNSGSVAAQSLAAEDYIYVYASGDAYVTQIVSIASDTLTVADRTPMPFTTAATAVVYKINPRINCGVRNMRFDANGNTGVSTRAIDTQGNINCRYENLYATGFAGSTTGGAFNFSFGYGNVYKTFTMDKSGCANQSDFQTFANTKSVFDDLESQRAAGFGPQWIDASYCTIQNIRASRTNGRAIKFARLRYSAVANLVASNAQGANGTGVMISGGSSRNTFNGIDSSYNADSGLTFAGTDGGDTYNVVNGANLVGNTAADLMIGTGAKGNDIRGQWGSYQDDGSASGFGCNVKNGILQNDAGLSALTNSVTETDIFKAVVPAGLPGKKGLIRFGIVGTLLNNSGAGRTYTLKLKIGATTVLADVTLSATASASARLVRIEGEILMLGALNSQMSWMNVSIGAPNSATTGTGGYDTVVLGDNGITNNTSVDFASEQTITATITMGVNTATQTWTRISQWCELLHQ